MRHWRRAVFIGICGVHAAAVAAMATGHGEAPKVAAPVLEARLLAEPEPVPPEANPPPQAQPPLPPQTPAQPPSPKPESRPKPENRPKPAAQPTPAITAAPAAAPAAAATPSATADTAPPSPPPAPAAVARASEREPAAITCRAPAYPADAKRRHQTGTVILDLLIDADGTVAEQRIETSSGWETLDLAALAALSRCRFVPGTVDGRPHRAWVRLRYVWRLE